MRRARYSLTETVTLKEVATAIGKTKRQTFRLLGYTGLRVRYGRLQKGREAQYDKRVIDLLHALLGQPHRPLTGAETDWLSEYINSGGDAHAP